MTVPSSIQQVLKKHNVVYSLADLPLPPLADVHQLTENSGQQIARAQLLQNFQQEKLLAIAPNQSILDLDSVERAMGDPYTPVIGEGLKRVVSKLGLQSMAAMPQIGNLPTIVDSKLLDNKNLLLALGINNQHIKLDNESFQKLLSATVVSDISTPLNAINVSMSSDTDYQQISHSVGQFSQRRIKQRLEETLELPPLPAIAKRIIQLRVDPNVDVSDLCEVIELDASLAAQVVSWASSPYYSAPGMIKSIHDAVVRVLGFDMVMNLALGLALGNTLKLPTRCPDGGLSYWQQSVYVAACTESLICCMPRELRPGYGSSYLAGLLHNFGYLIMAEVFPDKFETICEHIDGNPHAAIDTIEQKIIGVDRNQLVAWLMDFWNLPKEVYTALRHQNNPTYSGEHWQYSVLIYITKKLLNEKGIHMGVSAKPVSDATLDRFQLKREDALEAMDMILESQEMLQEIAEKMQS
ncbi:hypothetical protein AB835_05140 [Candidatus Endobugula sertula]|uniref:HDOD domain-containing protein n=1 Tax=Candidatus Endobugula sertula TaxID=62101 RepID=A0A1D2QRG2_9GAMM|nr:hypothetical protein AB835_05140 [Candidatus Endobugula sertula]